MHLFIKANSVWLMISAIDKMNLNLCNTPNMQTFVLVCIRHTLFEFFVAVALPSSLFLQDYVEAC